MKILIVDDHPLFTDGLQVLLEACEITVVGTVRDGAEALTAVRELLPDLVLMDIQMPGCDGLTATRLIKSEFPAIKIVILTMFDDDQALFDALKNGAAGFLLKNLETAEFLGLLDDVTNGKTVLSPGLANRMLQECVSNKNKAQATREKGQKYLTPRQEEVLVLIAEGYTYKQVAEQLGISDRTVKFHMTEILERLQLENRSQAIAYAAQVNLAGFGK